MGRPKKGQREVLGPDIGTTLPQGFSNCILHLLKCSFGGFGDVCPIRQFGYGFCANKMRSDLNGNREGSNGINGMTHLAKSCAAKLEIILIGNINPCA